MTHTKSSTEQAIEQLCPDCHHSLVDNNHGFDQNDGWMEGDKLVHSGQCTYCKECNPRLNAAALAREQATPEHGLDVYELAGIQAGIADVEAGRTRPLAEIEAEFKSTPEPAMPTQNSTESIGEYHPHTERTFIPTPPYMPIIEPPAPSARAAIAADELVEGCADIRVPNVQFGGTNGLDSAQREAILALKGRYALTEVPMETYSDDYVRIPKVTLECLEARNSELCNIGFDLGMVIPERCLQVRAEVVKRISPLTDAECTEHDKPLVGEAESEQTSSILGGTAAGADSLASTRVLSAESERERVIEECTKFLGEEMLRHVEEDIRKGGSEEEFAIVREIPNIIGRMKAVLKSRCPVHGVPAPAASAPVLEQDPVVNAADRGCTIDSEPAAPKEKG